MLIEKFIVPATELGDSGLQPITMTRLGRFVALTGPNGAGKTRVLNTLEQYIHQRSNIIPRLAEIISNIANLTNFISNNPGHASSAQWKAQCQGEESQFERATARVFVSTAGLAITAIHFVPKQLGLIDPRALARANTSSYYEQAKQPGIGGFEQKCFAYIQALQDRHWEATHPKSQIPKDRQAQIEQDYANLEHMIKALLKTTLTRSEDSNASIFGRPLADANLSDGQKILIQMTVAIHAQKGKLENSVFLLDEPENHLHPAGLIEFLSALSDAAINSQIWLATHSIPLLAYVSGKEPMSIWYVEDGKVSNAGRHPEIVLRGLLGDDDQISLLHAFTGLPAQYAAINFAAESLLAPKVLANSEGDHQVAQINTLIRVGATENRVALLDFGAGKGRLILGLKELLEDKGFQLSDKLDYFAFDTSPDDRDVCQAAIHAAYGDDQCRWFSSRELFFSTHDESSLDVVVLCNVMHEIPPTDWLSIFGHGSLIYRALKPSGYVLIVEDQRVPTGEKAHKFGFLVLDTPHIRTLFAVKDEDTRQRLFLSDDFRHDGRLKAHAICKALLSRMTSTTRRKSIEELQATARDRIRALRSQPPDYKSGQLHGFWTQQFANASLFLEEA